MRTTRRFSYPRYIVLIAVLSSLTFSLQGDPERLESVSKKVFCNCGCGEILAECSHLDCPRKGALKREISSLIMAGNDDRAILDELGAKHGASILATPAFRGFNALLWVVPVVVGVISIAGMLVRRRKAARMERPAGQA